MLQRPLTGEPLALDLVNTEWLDSGRSYDLFDDPDALLGWLREHQLAPTGPDGATSGDAEFQRFQPPLRHTRAAIRGLLEGAPDAAEALAVTLHHGRIRLLLDGHRPGERVELDDETWRPAWTAARAYLRLLDGHPDRIRRCAGCVLWFLDTSRNGTRRWCSMDECGNRAKAQAHYRRRRTSQP